MIVLASDCFGDVEPLRRELERLRFFGHDVFVLQILAPEEISFPFRRSSFFHDLESPGRIHVNPSAVRSSYLQEFQTFRNRLRQATLEIGVDLATLSTADNLGDALAFHLRRRAAAMRRKATR